MLNIVVQNKKPVFHYLDLKCGSTIDKRELKDYVSCINSFQEIIRQKKKMKKHILEFSPKEKQAVTSLTY